MASKYNNLYHAVSDGTIDDVKYFVEKKGEKVEEGILISCGFRGTGVEVLEFLISKGANVNAKEDYTDNTALHGYARYSNNVEVLEYLISKGANVNAKCSLGKTPMHEAADANPHIEILECLIAKGADVNVKDKHNSTPLHHAILNNPNEDVLGYLVSKGADAYAKNSFGFSPIDFAEKHGKRHLLPENRASSSGGGGCYVATCVYGSYDCPEVWTLRRYRDTKLSKSWFGKRFVHVYYAVSPKIVEVFGNKKWFNRLLKPILNKIVRKLQNSGIGA